jgi:signal-transduction protein with cAMP-binding, CBS, and nucleotidyltransferase domain
VDAIASMVGDGPPGEAGQPPPAPAGHVGPGDPARHFPEPVASGQDPGVGQAPELLTIERVAVLQRVAMFSSVPGHTLVAVARLLDEVRVEPGTTFIRRGDVEDWLFVVAEGKGRAHVGERALGDRGPGDVVGELSVLAPAARSASVTALEPTLLLRLRRRPFEELLEDSAEIAVAVIASLARRMQELADDDAAEAP